MTSLYPEQFDRSSTTPVFNFLDRGIREFASPPLFLNAKSSTHVKYTIDVHECPSDGGLVVFPPIVDFGIIKQGCSYQTSVFAEMFEGPQECNAADVVQPRSTNIVVSMATGQPPYKLSIDMDANTEGLAEDIVQFRTETQIIDVIIRATVLSPTEYEQYRRENKRELLLAGARLGRQQVRLVSASGSQVMTRPEGLVLEFPSSVGQPGSSSSKPITKQTNRNGILNDPWSVPESVADDEVSDMSGFDDESIAIGGKVGIDINLNDSLGNLSIDSRTFGNFGTSSDVLKMDAAVASGSRPASQPPSRAPSALKMNLEVEEYPDDLDNMSFSRNSSFVEMGPQATPRTVSKQGSRAPSRGSMADISLGSQARISFKQSDERHQKEHKGFALSDTQFAQYIQSTAAEVKRKALK